MRINHNHNGGENKAEVSIHASRDKVKQLFDILAIPGHNIGDLLHAYAAIKLLNMRTCKVSEEYPKYRIRLYPFGSRSQYINEYIYPKQP